MKEKNITIKILQLMTIISLYYIVGNNSIFIYVLSLSLYNIFTSCFNHISFKDTFDKFKDNYHKQKFLNLSILTIGIISLAFLLLSIAISDLSSSIMKIKDAFLVFFLMGLSIFQKPLINLLLDYLESTKRNKLRIATYNICYISELILLLLISILNFHILKIPTNNTLSLMYLPKIIILIIILIILFKISSQDKKIKNELIEYPKYNYKKELKKVLTKNHRKSIIDIVKNSYFYLSIIILYLVLTTRYKYAINVIDIDLTFIYFYALNIINSLIEIIAILVNNNNNTKDISNHMYLTIKIMLPIIIILSIISPLTCKLIFNNSNQSIYLVMLNFMSLFFILYNITSNNLNNKKILSISLFTGLIIKIITIIPLINAFYRMGYNLIYGDIISTIISLSITIIINYMTSPNKSYKGQNYLDKILNIMYENILLSIILIIIQFIIPISTDNYLKTLFITIIYLSVSIAFLKIKNKYKEQKRG